MPRSTAAPLAIGDRVRERERVADDVVTRQSPNFAQVASILGQRRTGVIVGVETRRNRRGGAIHYARVQWDHLGSPSLHARFRLEKLHVPSP